MPTEESVIAQLYALPEKERNEILRELVKSKEYTKEEIAELAKELQEFEDSLEGKPEAIAPSIFEAPVIAREADKLINDIIGAPKVNAKTKRKLDSIQKESKTKADDAISKAEEIDSITDEMNDKLDDDLCI